MKKYLILFNLLIINLAFAQVSFKILNLKTIDHNKYLLKICIINESDKKLAIPLDKVWFKGYFSPDICPKFEDIEYPYLAPTILIKNERQEYVEAKSTNLGYIDDKHIKTDNNFSSKESEKRKLINNWMKKENINNYSKAMTNLYIINNIVLLQPKQNFSYEIQLDISEIKYSRFSALHDEYPLEANNNYHLSLAICVDKDIYGYLTSAQIKKLKKYNLFTGKIESNEIEVKY
ncbi:hypothetical protein [Chryseobacterium sp. EO14]|uniref:hypothetical protein n=1 Tax=Chryseobacterium sp. EO14 TaxID=2950551 RepID=UPI0021095085|nr:hypothetical protein [Chryseobacterium sp. EO14]MCQ4142713.1 hypothetical protein [Chryseobacterium sp. EO14]